MKLLLVVWLCFAPTQAPTQVCREIDDTRKPESAVVGEEVLLVDNEIWSGTFDDAVCLVEGWKDGLLILRPQSQRAYYHVANPPSALCMQGPWQEYVVAVANLHTVKVLKRR